MDCSDCHPPGGFGLQFSRIHRIPSNICVQKHTLTRDDYYTRTRDFAEAGFNTVPTCFACAQPCRARAHSDGGIPANLRVL
ncbi:MAG TPA: hypothetical protein VFZ76_13115 [Anaerolineales bacterium]